MDISFNAIAFALKYNSLQIDKVANGAMQRYIKNTQSMATWVTNQRYITLYGG